MASSRVPAGGALHSRRGSRLAPSQVNAPVEYQLHNLEGGGGARVSGELTDGRFAIETDEPHVKIAWRVTGRRAADERGTEDAG